MGYDCDKMVEIICSDKNIKKKALKKPDNKGITAYFIKYCCVITAAGCASDPVYLVADANMSEDVIDVHVVKGLGCSTSITSKSYLVFSKTRWGMSIIKGQKMSVKYFKNFNTTRFVCIDWNVSLKFNNLTHNWSYLRRMSIKKIR